METPTTPTPKLRNKPPPFYSLPIRGPSSDADEEELAAFAEAALIFERYKQARDGVTCGMNMENVRPLENGGKEAGGEGGVTASQTQGKGKPRLLLMGQRRSGKSSISSVVFHKMPPNETLFLESTARITKDSMHSFMDFTVWDFPGQLDFLDPSFDTNAIFGSLGSLIWVIDAQDDYLDALSRLCSLIMHLSIAHPTINIEVFIHKTDGLSDDYKFDLQRDIMQRVQDECSDMGLENINVGWHSTSIYNHSIFEAFSRVIQKLIPWLGWAEGLLNELCRACRFEKVYLFDVMSKIYIATDSSPVDMGCYEICSDFIDVVVDVSGIYGWERPEEYVKSLEGEPFNKKIEDQVGCRDAEATVILKDGRRPIVLREVDRYLALVGVLREGGAERLPEVRQNIEVMVRGLEKVFEVTRGKR